MWTGIPKDKLDGLREKLAGLPVKVTVSRRKRGARVGVTLKVLLDARRRDTKAEWHEVCAAMLRAVDWANGAARPQSAR